MELFSAPWWSALLAIVLIDLVLAGDNAIVIALAARNLPPHLQKKAIVWGTFGAIAVRSLMTVGVVWLLKIPGLMLVGGLGLLWIAYRLIADTGYGSAAMLGWLVQEKGIEPHIPVFDKSKRTDGTFSRSDFAYDDERNLYVCPGGKELRHYRRQFKRARPPG